MSKNSKLKPIVYIPHKKQKTRYSEEIKIDGCAYIQFGNQQDVMNFVNNYRANMNLRRLNLICYTYRDLKKYAKIQDDFQKMSKEQFQSERNLLWWLLDPNGGESFRDQYVIRFQSPQGEETHIYWNDENEVKDGRSLCYDASDLKADRKVNYLFIFCYFQ